MRASQIQLYLISLLLILLGLGMTLYKHFALDFPLLPGQTRQVWSVEAQIRFQAEGKPVSVSLARPLSGNGYEILRENYASSGYGFSLAQRDQQPRAEWTARQADGEQIIYYSLQVSRFDDSPADLAATAAPEIPRVDLDEPLLTAAQALIDQAQRHSADPRSLAIQLLQRLNSPNPSQEVRSLLSRTPNQQVSAELVVDLLHLAGLPAQVIKGLLLEDGRRNLQLEGMIELFDGDQRYFFDPRSSSEGLPDNFLIWQRGHVSLLDVVGGSDSSVGFSISASSASARSLALQSAKAERVALIDFSIYTLPIADQNAFKTILLVPIGTLIVVFLRIIIGIRTSGTFMPILMALAFIQTTLLTGILIFLIVVSIGLWIRSALSNLNLLLVARISSVVIVVIGIMSGLSIISFKLGLEQILTVTFFPMIILSWTIERMSILWEEEGAREVMIQGFGSLLVASLAYLVMTNRLIEHLTFNFPELLLVILAFNLMLGQYTGYRLSELVRFAPMVRR